MTDTEGTDMDTPEPRRLQTGDIDGIYEILDPTGFAGVLPTAVIRDGFTNAGVRVNLTSGYACREQQ